MSELVFKEGVVKDYTIVLSTRDFRHLGQLTGISGVKIPCKLNAANEISFDIYKTQLMKYDERSTIPYDLHLKIKNDLWKQIVDFKLVWVKERNEYYEIKVNSIDSTDTIKTITGISLCEAELSQTETGELEINTEADIERPDYEVTTFCNMENPKASLLHRVLEKAPHYTIKHVDKSLMDLQRVFSIDTNIYDFFVGECSEQINCLFIFDSSERGVYVYDLYTVCEDCGERGEFYDECPECGSKNLKYFGEDTTILVDKDNLTDEIQLEIDKDSTKNCFTLVAGDDLMTATVRLLIPNGSNNLIHFSKEQLDDMPSELVNLLNSYDELVASHDEQYKELVSEIYDLTDQILYLESGMMPTIEQAEITAETEAEKLNEMNLSPLGLSSVTSSTSVSTVNSALKNYAKVYVKTGYVKLDIADDATFNFVGEDNDGWNYGVWNGRFIVTNYSDEEDVVTTDNITVIVHDNYEEFIRQKILKNMAQENTDEYSVFDVLNIDELEDFKNALTLYCKNRLESFYDAIQAALDVLIQVDQASEYADLYNVLYVPYYEKLQACQEELDKRTDEINKVQTRLDEADSDRMRIQSKLDLKQHLGEYYNILCAYRREQKYSNDNYISDGLSNTELIERALEFIETAKKELIKASEPQYTISSTLNNLLVLPEFKPIVEKFKLGNWIRVKIDGNLYRLRLIGYTINFDNLQTIEVEFSTISRLKDDVYDVRQVIKSAQSMATSYGYVSKQAEKGKEANNSINDWLQNGLNSGLIQIKNNEHEEVITTKSGLLCRTWDDITGTYEDKQLKITHNVIAFTDDNWETVRQVIGEHSYITYDEKSDKWVNATGYGMSSDFVLSGYVISPFVVGGEIYSRNYVKGLNGETPKGTYIDLENGTFSFGGGNLTYDGEKLRLSADGTNITELSDQYIKSTNVIAENLQINGANVLGKLTAASIDVENLTGKTLTGKEFIGGSLLIGDKSNTYAEITKEGILNCNGANFTGAITGSSFYASGTVTKYASDYTESDVTKAQNIIMGLEECTVEDINRLDMDGDNIISGIDVLRISKLLSGYSTSYSFDTYIKINPANTSSLISTQGISIGMNGMFTKNIRTDNAYLHNILVPVGNSAAYLSGITQRITIGDITLDVNNGIITGIL